MAFTLLGGIIRGASDIAGDAVGVIHRTTDATLDKTGLSAFVPPAVHEIGDGIFGLTQRSIKALGHTTGDILESFDNRPLHAHDKSIGGNLKKPKDGSKKKKPKDTVKGKPKEKSKEKSKAKAQVKPKENVKDKPKEKSKEKAKGDPKPKSKSEKTKEKKK